MIEALHILQDSMLAIIISITFNKIRHKDVHGFERLLFIIILFTF